MKLTIVLFFVSLAQMMATETYAQLTKLTLQVKDKTVKEVLKQIEDNSDFFFLYNAKLVDVDFKVCINAQDEKIDQILNNIFRQTDVVYTVIDKQIVLTNKANQNGFVQPDKQQIQKITGAVTDKSGTPLPGVNVVVTGTTIGAMTDIDGKYSIAVPSGSKSLTFSFIGLAPQEIILGANNQINAVMSEMAIGLDEVVVIGYGTQKKSDLTGSIANVSLKELDSRPITQTSQALSGLVSGVIVSQESSRPGKDAASIIIRGMGTFSSAGNSPLVLVDGLASSINDLDPNNIKSISVLKDAASASIYGTRAANGVILIETKRGQKGKLQISYDNYVGWQKATELPQFLESWEFATLKNEANANDGRGRAYTDEEIAKFKSGSDPDNYPNVPHLKNLLNSGSGFQAAHHVSFTGGDEINSYFFSLGYLRHDGMVAKNDYNKYSFVLNVDSKINDNLKLKIDLSGNTGATNEPRHQNGDMIDMIQYAIREGPIYAGKKSDGTYGHLDDYSPEAWIASESFNKDLNKNLLGGVDLSWEIFKGLTLSGKAGYNYNNYTNNNFAASFIFDQYKTVGSDELIVTSGDNSLLTLQSLVKYEKEINEHSFNVLLGFSQEEYREDWTRASRDKFPNTSLYELNAGAASNMKSSGSASEWALRSYFGRLNYSFNKKYLFEANIRYDGTSRFPPKSRWGLFPSFSAGWRISEEPFIKDNVGWIDNLKLRASWGKLGNQNVGNYPFQNVLTLGQNYSFGGVLASGALVTTMANSEITWESTEITDIGLDLTVLKGKLSMEFDYFNKITSDILYNISVSSVLGLTPSETNAGEVKNTGIELSLNYQTSIGKLNLGVIPNFSYIKNEVTKLATVEKDIAKGLFIGQPLNSIYGYVADGMFVDDQDVASYPTQPFLSKPGYIRLKDISGPDGIPDGVVNATYDRKAIGSTFPKYTYGITITADYKGFDFSLLLQGLAGFTKQLSAYEGIAFYNDGQIQRWQADNRWTIDNPDRNAKYPRLVNVGFLNEEFTTISSFWSRNASFLRVKNLQIGYSFSNNLIQKLKISKLRIFASGQNLFSLNHFYEGWDPERTMGGYYPITSAYTFGVNVKF